MDKADPRTRPWSEIRAKRAAVDAGAIHTSGVPVDVPTKVTTRSGTFKVEADPEWVRLVFEFLKLDWRYEEWE